MKILVIGAGGMIGRKLVEHLLTKGTLRGEAISHLTVYDIFEPEFSSSDFEITSLSGDFGTPGEADKLVQNRPDIIFHLAAIVSGEAEQEFEKGYRINLDGSRDLFETIKSIDGYTPRVVFASSIAVFGAPFPDIIDDDYHRTPLTSYGTQKAIVELLLTDFTRKGHFDGIGIRFPTIVVRPGKPNLAASGFFSNIIREPLAGQDAVLPVSKDVMHWMASPRSAVGFCIRAAEIDGEDLGPHRNLSMPGLAITVGEMIEGLRKIAGEDVVAHIQHDLDPVIVDIVSNWPRNFIATRAEALGFAAETSFEDVVRAHIEDELGGSVTP